MTVSSPSACATGASSSTPSMAKAAGARRRPIERYWLMVSSRLGVDPARGDVFQECVQRRVEVGLRLDHRAVPAVRHGGELAAAYAAEQRLRVVERAAGVVRAEDDEGGDRHPRKLDAQDGRGQRNLPG